MKKENIVITSLIVIVIIVMAFCFLKDRWFKEKVRDEKYTVTGRILWQDFNTLYVRICIKDNTTNKNLIRYDSKIYVCASEKPRNDNYSIECTDEYIAIRLISDDETEYRKDKEHYNNKDRLYEGIGERFYYEDLEKISNQ